MNVSRYTNIKPTYDENGNLYYPAKFVDLTEISNNTYVCARPTSLREIALEIYGNSQFWWILASANDLSSFHYTKVGDVLKYPDIVDVLIELGEQ